MNRESVFVGIDVAKARLDIALWPTARGWSVPNDPEGVADLVTRLHGVEPALVVLEATGGLELPVTAALATAGLPVVVVNPRQVRDFAKATGKLAKTDTIDAHVLAHFAQAVRPMPRPLPDTQAQELSALLARRRQLTEMLTAEKNRLQTALPRVRPEVQEHITWLKQSVAKLDGDLGAREMARPEGFEPTTLGSEDRCSIR